MKRNPYKKEFLASLAKGRVLDCGFAWSPNPYLKDAIGIDIEMPKEKPINYSDIVQSDLNQKLPFGDESFDAIIAGDVIEHLYNPFGFLKECKRVLRKEGKMIISMPNGFLYILHDDSPFHLYEWSYLRFRRLLNHYFDVERCYGSIFDLFGFKINLRKFPFFSHIVIYECRKKDEK